MEVKFPLPDFTEHDAVRLAGEWYGLKVSARELPSERDRNFYLKSDLGREFVLKIANRTEDPAVLDLQNRTMEHLKTRVPDLKIPHVCESKTGVTVPVIHSRKGEQHFLRLLTYVPAKLFANTKPHSPELLRSLGRTLGIIGHGLLDLKHPAAQRQLKWDIARASWIREYVPFISDPAKRVLVESFLQEFENRVAPVLATLRSSVIYNDANDYNILVEQNQVIGVIDFGDMVHTQTVCDLAVGAAYAMLGKPDPVTAAAHVVAGYHGVLPIEDAELKVLFHLICARLCITVTNAAYQRQAEPDNHYLAISEDHAWKVLEKLAEVPQRLPYFRFRHSCGLNASPNSVRVIEWLKSNPHTIGPLVEIHQPVLLNLGVGSRVPGNLSEVLDTSAFAGRLFGQMAASKSDVGVGRYNEARVLTSPHVMKLEGNEGPEWRTIHLGLDLFLQPGTPVFVPLDGIIHSYRNNSSTFDYGPTILLKHHAGEVPFYTLYGHLSPDSLEGLQPEMPVRKGNVLGKVGSKEVNGGWPPHLHFQMITELLGMRGDFPGNALPSQRDFWLNLCPDPNLIARLPAELLRQEEWNQDRILGLRSQYIGKALSVSYRKPLHIVRGYMQHLYDAEGQAYLDCVNNVAHVGHCHPRVVRAGAEQMNVLNTNTRYLHENLVRYARRLCSTFPEPLRVCIFVNSGSEANELALRMARAHSRRKDIVVLEAAYHGNTGGLIEISPYKFSGPGGAGAPSYVHRAPMPDPFRGIYRREDPLAGEKYAQFVKEALQNDCVAAFICESMPSVGGQIIFPDGYLRKAFQYVRDAGAVCIADEVQTGFGRVGSHFWAFETQDVVPDIVTLGKPIGNGHPLGAVVTTPEIAASFANGMEYFNTFGGNPVSCAIGLAVLDVIEEERLQENALQTGMYLIAGLRRLMEEFPLIGDVRGCGLFLGIELVKDRESLTPATEQASYLMNRMRERGILLSTDGPYHNVVKMKPPMVFGRSDADFLLSALNEILQEDLLIAAVGRAL